MNESTGQVHSAGKPEALGSAGSFKSWNTIGIGFAEDTHVGISFIDTSVLPLSSALLRISIGAEFHSGCVVDVHSSRTGDYLGCFDIRFPCMFQPFHLALGQEHLPDLLAGGVALSLREPGPELRIIYDCPEAGCLPALVFYTASGNTPAGKWAALTRGLYSFAGLQPFNWIEGCVLDALADMALSCGHAEALQAFNRHLGCFVDDTGRLDYIGPTGTHIENRLVGIEAGLPFAGIARIHPYHPVLMLFDKYLVDNTGPEGLVLDRAKDAEGRSVSETTVTIEGCYTLAYPAALRGVILGEIELLYVALDQIILRAQMLVDDGLVHQRCVPGVPPEQKSWARGTCWYLLGAAKTIRCIRGSRFQEELCEPLGMLEEVLRSVCNTTRHLQRSDGLWNNYLDDPRTGVDTSGSAGIATAFAILNSMGILDDSYRAVAEKASDALSEYILPDGHLSGAAQLNRGGEALQRGNYRVAAPFASALALQLLVAMQAGKPDLPLSTPRPGDGEVVDRSDKNTLLGDAFTDAYCPLTG